MKIRPLEDHILVEPIVEDRTPGGILLPDATREKYGRARVLAVGPGRPDRRDGAPEGARFPVSVRVGEVVLHGRYAGTEVDIEDGGRRLRLLAHADVLAVIDENS